MFPLSLLLKLPLFHFIYLDRNPSPSIPLNHKQRQEPVAAFLTLSAALLLLALKFRRKGGHTWRQVWGLSLQFLGSILYSN